MQALVHRADVPDRNGGVLVMATLFDVYPFLLKLYAGGGDQGPAFQAGVRRVCRSIEIVKRSDTAKRTAKGITVLPKRWSVERTIAWLKRCHRLAKDWECLTRKALTFLNLASIRLMLRSSAKTQNDPGRTLKISTLGIHRFNARIILCLFGHMHLDEIDRKTLGEFIATRKRTGVTDATIRRHLSFLGSVFTSANRRGWVDIIFGHNPQQACSSGK